MMPTLKIDVDEFFSRPVMNGYPESQAGLLVDTSECDRSMHISSHIYFSFDAFKSEFPFINRVCVRVRVCLL